ncbi:MAG: B12-binding domain-containing radical SAM protein [Ferruginibacter sp.]
MSKTVFLITPPFTQLNTPYPATAYLKGFLNTRNISSYQADLGIEVTNALFCRQGLSRLFELVEKSNKTFSGNIQRILLLKEDYINTIDDAVLFLQGKNPTIAHFIGKRDFLPEAARFAQLDDMDWAFGSMGIQDKAKHIATMYLEDLSDLIQETVDEHFGFSRYAERLGRSANSFDELYASLQQSYTYVDELLIDILEKRIREINPQLVALSVPFPGNLYTSFRCGQWIKKNHPQIKIVMGGGFANTELRSLSDIRVFEFFDFITLDDGEAPIENLIGYVTGTKTKEELKRTFVLEDGSVKYINNSSCKDYRQGDVGTPDYSDFFLDKYISAIEVVNPMHRLWSDGRWNKLTMAHGCYWGKCTFCDISLDYIKNYEPIAASLLCDRMEEMIAQTGQNGFHFVDEAAPPALMRSLAIEILRRKLTVSWWTNVRFEKSFTRDLCLLLKASGCIAVSGGLEVASDRLLELIQKGITVAQVARVNKHFTQAGIMVHAYLMYGFPTQTAQETIDSLEMVRQLFKTGVLQSAYWHQFAMTAHSPVGMQPEKYKVVKETEVIGRFANNDIVHIDPTGADHESFSYGLKKSLFNYMHNLGIDEPLQKWFEQKVPKTKVDPGFIEQALLNDEDLSFKPNAKVIFTGRPPSVEYFTQSKKGMSREMATLSFVSRQGNHSIPVLKQQADWLKAVLEKIHISNSKVSTLKELMEDYEAATGMDDFELFWDNKPMNTIWKAGVLQF